MRMPKYLSQKVLRPSCAKSNAHDIGKPSGLLTLERECWLACRTCERKYPILNTIPFLTIQEGDKWIETTVAELPIPSTSA
jgi:uncharacterized protein YbaR (Trm112 family)